MLIALDRIHIPVGQKVVLQDITRQEFEILFEEVGNHHGLRLAYDQGVLEMMVPLPAHEDNKEIIGDLLKTLLEELDIEFRSLGSTTFKKPTSQGIESDQCFYIQNEAAIRGKKRINLDIDPPPNLAIDVDVTSRTHPNIEAALRVPELWWFEQGMLQINILISGQYQEVSTSPNFPDLALGQIIPYSLAESKTLGRNKTIKSFHERIRDQQRS